MQGCDLQNANVTSLKQNRIQRYQKRTKTQQESNMSFKTKMVKTKEQTRSKMMI